MRKVNLAARLAQIGDYWNPLIVGELNGQHVKLVTLRGEFVWHHHDDEDEMFLVLDASLTMRLCDREVAIGVGEFFIVPRGVEHQPVAPEEVCVLLFEPAGTLNTGNIRNDLTVDNPQHA